MHAGRHAPECPQEKLKNAVIHIQRRISWEKLNMQLVGELWRKVSIWSFAGLFWKYMVLWLHCISNKCEWAKTSGIYSESKQQCAQRFISDPQKTLAQTHWNEVQKVLPSVMHCVYCILSFWFVLISQLDARSIGVEFEWVEEVEVCILYHIFNIIKMIFIYCFHSFLFLNTVFISFLLCLDHRLV